MKFLDKDIDEAIAAIELPKPVISPVLSYSGDYLYFRMNTALCFNEEKLKTIPQLIVACIKSSTYVKLSVDENKYYTESSRDAIYRNIKYSMLDYIVDFIAKKGGFTNNRLSSLYKWYRDKIQNSLFLSNETFMSDLYEFTKFSTTGNQYSTEHLKVCRTLLTLIKDRYESLETKPTTKRKNQ